jgi:endonuclease/exonuclease/phosphatase family metal-dependent hydrolase
MPSFSILSVNIEGDNHLETIQALIKQKEPDIVCLQEIFQQDVTLFETQMQVKGLFVPLCSINSSTRVRLNPRGEWGIAIFSKLPVLELSVLPYQGELNHIPPYDNDDPNSTNRALLLTKVQIGTAHSYVATTHFTWSMNGEVTELQKTHVERVSKLLHPYSPLLLCGDFNAPRGKAIFQRLADQYTDNIPANETTTIDQNLHRKKGIQFVVDGMFSTPQLKAQHVEVIDGVSDHKALFGVFDLL